MMKMRLLRRSGLGWMVLLAAAGGCTPKQYARQADQAAYATIGGGREAALGEGRPFEVIYRPFSSDADPRGSIRVGDKEIPIGDVKAVTLALDECLEIACRNSRAFQDRKEQLYALALTLADRRRGWAWPLPGGDVTGDASHSRVGKDPASDTNASSAEGVLNLTRRFVTGGALALAATLNFATDFLGADSTPVGSLIELNFTQPLLRGAWRDLAYEDQYRLERDFLFAIFDYERFTQTFSVGILTEYYGVLQRLDRLENEKQNIARLEDTVLVTKRLVSGGHSSPVESDQAEQNLINARVRYEQNLQAYEDSLDAFKIQIGLPLAAAAELDYPDALKALNQIGPLPVGMNVEQAIAASLTTNSNVLTQRAGVRDAARDVEIAADGFLPRVDVALGVSAPGTPAQRFHRVQFDRHTRTAELEFEYELDQTAHRNTYRNALIALAKAKRDYAQFLDQTIRLGVRRSYRNLMQSRKTYELQKRGLAIAVRRRAIAIREQRAGRAKARDVLEAEDAWRDARNGLTEALIGYTTTRLSFLAGLGMLWVDEKGKIHERKEPARFDRLGRRHPYVEMTERQLNEAFDGGE